MHASVNVALVPLLGLEPVDKFRRGFLAEAATGFGGLVQCCDHILRHARGIAADVEMGSVLEPRPKFGSLFQHSVLHVDLFPLIAGKSCGKPGEMAGREHLLQFLAVIEIRRGSLLAKEEPVSTFCACGPTFVQKGAKRRNAGPRTDHDDRHIASGREVYVQSGPGLQAFIKSCMRADSQ